MSYNGTTRQTREEKMNNIVSVDEQNYDKSRESSLAGVLTRFMYPGAFTRLPAPGDVVMRNCYGSSGSLLAAAGDVLTDEQIGYLLNNAPIPPILSAVGLDAASASALALYGTRFRDELAVVADLLDNVITDPSQMSDDILLKALPYKTMDAPLPWIMRLASLDATTQGHCLNVALLTGVIAKRFVFKDEIVERAMVCALLHDIGKLKIERDLLEAKRSLTDTEFEYMKTHSRIGYEMLKGRGGVIERAALVALRHHVKQQGKGYPDDVCLSELKDIDLIVQFCDIFDALVTKRPYKNIIPPLEALRIVYRDFEEKIETQVAKICIETIQDGFIGAEVVMADGSYGTLIDIINRKPVGFPVVKLRTGGKTLIGDGTRETEPVRIIGVI